MDTAELVGRLATAVAEQDVLYVLCWLKEMHARDLLSSESGVRGLQLRCASPLSRVSEARKP